MRVCLWKETCSFYKIDNIKATSSSIISRCFQQTRVATSHSWVTTLSEKEVIGEPTELKVGEDSKLVRDVEDSWSSVNASSLAFPSRKNGTQLTKRQKAPHLKEKSATGRFLIFSISSSNDGIYNSRNYSTGKPVLQKFHVGTVSEQSSLREVLHDDMFEEEEEEEEDHLYGPDADLELPYLQSKYYSTENYLANATIVNEALENPYEIFEEQWNHTVESGNQPEAALSDLFQLSLFREYQLNDSSSFSVRTRPSGAVVRVRKRQVEDPKYAEELRLEFACLQESLDRFRNLLETAVKRGDIGWLSPAQRLILSWLSPLAFAIKREQQRLKVKISLTKDESHLLRLEPAKLALITIQETLRLTVPRKEGYPYLSLCLEVGKAVQTQCNAEELERLRKKLQYEQVHQETMENKQVDNTNTTLTESSESKESSNSFRIRLHQLKKLLKRNENDKNGHRPYINLFAYRLTGNAAFWDKLTTLRVGSYLVDMLLKNAPTQQVLVRTKASSDSQFVSAFWHKTVRGNGNKLQGLVGCRDIVYDILSRDLSNPFLNPLPRLRPMVVVPKPWTGPKTGGYLRIRSDLMRCEHSHRSQWNALRTANLSKVYEGLNALGATPWKVNTKILEVAEELWRRGGGIAGLVNRERIDVPKINFNDFRLLPRNEMTQIRGEIREAKKAVAERHALTCQTEIILQEAREFAKYDVFYLPHNMDFRGRAYPIPSTLHHMSSDLHRGLLMFASPGKPLGERGVYWLKVHIANLAGQDKATFEDRVRWTENHSLEIIQVAQDPLDPNNLEWWSTREDPFQFLAACVEFANAASQGNSMSHYCSSVPIQMDGSCNGLQHYAALARDCEGAFKVNLLPCDKPQDVYSAVCDRVRVMVEKDAERGLEEAKLALKCLSRKVVKQTVMTSVYGVTLIGARLQIENRLREAKLIEKEWIFKVSSYLASRTLESIGNLFEVADRTMEWLSECAQKIAHTKQAVSWITPLGLPIYQPYRSKVRLDVKTAMQIVSMQLYDESLPIEKRKQMTAFPPNYIHSLDSSHMLMTASACVKEGMYFAAVHDSFWTSAADVDRMNRILRETFVGLHSNNLLWQLYEYFRSRYPQVDFRPPPERGTLDIQSVLDAPFFFD
ncbi:DNA-directed RNA polymerase 3, chloroplastic [Galdieria sulphuraria]|uniref:DNA-directed RNA polymerase n=1 Tax=Galdieria sulphuraria TaxID=130081 RepID=M2X4M7_GALSU|nr:DNA-directed RNA polymerase, mitochondrial [Galdieria sulphuraria]EME31380.1 DNA-directed RNA polymerase, mitochondrial [Galdieria sulphuraria]GJD07262.1 DNA-directed RNA polymerase 3, chloroplastic [Galdieria sulphuraria]|eukprot:XP_005707900.1 DNA-directed RNA polymerase, mitochondrial [Galdieria sulphuraria]